MKVEKSCGCIVIDGRNVLLVKQTKGHWSFPKGHMEEGESEIQTAVREVKEETNVDAIPDETKRYVEEYLMDNGNMKHVIYFVSKQASSNIKAQESEIAESRGYHLRKHLKQLHTTTLESYY